MSPLLLALAFTGALDLPEQSLSSGPDPSIAIIASGSPDWEKQRANRIMDRLGALLSPQRPLLVGWFDAEPVLPRSFATRSANRQLIRMMPRTPMRDALETGLAVLTNTPGPRAMVVIARAQFYPTSIPISQILQQARLAAAPIYAIHLASGSDQAHPTKRAAHFAGNLFSQSFERLVIRQRSSSELDTLRQLNLLSETTGGWACQARDEDTAIACAGEVARRIEER